jgi:hypothetical protein
MSAFNFSAPSAITIIETTGELSSPLRIGDVANGNYSEFEADGTLEFVGDATVWIDYNFGVGALNRGAAAPDLINLSATSIETLGFDGVNTLEQVSTVLELNHNWREGSTIYPHVHWYPVNGNAGNVKWNMEYVIVARDGVVPASTTIVVVQAAGGVAWTERFASFPTIDASGFTIGAQMHIRLFRDPNDGDDTYGSDAALATFGLHVELDTVGSRQIASK